MIKDIKQVDKLKSMKGLKKLTLHGNALEKAPVSSSPQ